eukprot:3961222-Prymnesium_polylepis.1
MESLKRITGSAAYRSSNMSSPGSESACEELSMVLQELTALSEADTVIQVSRLKLIKKLGEGGFADVQLRE